MCDPINPFCRPVEAAPTESALGSSLTLLVWTAAITALDHFLLQPLVQQGHFPEAARVPSLFAGLTGAQAALNKLKLVNSSLTQTLRAIPTFTGLQVLARGALEAVGIKPGWGSEAAALTLASLPLFYARYSPQLADALTAAASGQGLAVKGLTAGAAALRLGATAVRALGWVSLVNFGGNWIADNFIGNLWAAGTGQFDTNKSLWNLERMSMEIYTNEHVGSFLGALLPLLPSDDDGIRKVRDDLVKTSDEVGHWLNDNFIAIALRNTRVLEDNNWSIDWDAVQTEIKNLYNAEPNADSLKNTYRLVGKATGPLTTSGIRYLTNIIDTEGNIDDLERFKRYLYRTTRLRFLEQKDAIERQAIRLGFAEEREGEVNWRIPTPDEGNDRNRFRSLCDADQLSFLDQDLSHWAALFKLSESL